MLISDWSSGVCSSDLVLERHQVDGVALPIGRDARREEAGTAFLRISERQEGIAHGRGAEPFMAGQPKSRAEEHTSELQSLMRISYAVFCLKQKKHNAQRWNETRTRPD